MMKKYIFIAMTLFGAACNQDAAIKQEFTDTPVIEGYLKPGDIFQVKISRQIPFIDDAIFSEDNINELLITVISDEVETALIPQGDGVYNNSNINCEVGKAYSVKFSFDHRLVEAITYIPIKPMDFVASDNSIAIARFDSASGPPTDFTMPDPIDLTWENGDGSYYLVVVENLESNLDPIRDFGGEEPPGNSFRKKPTSASGQQLSAMDFQYYGTHRVILFHVLPDYASLYDDTSNSSQNLTNPSTSITNGYGIFTGLNADTLIIEVTE